MEPAAVNDALFNHLVLPAQLPQRQEHDRQLRLVEGALLERLIGAASIMSGSETDNPSHSHWQSLRQTLIACQQVNRAGRIDKSSLVRRFQNLDPSGCLILHVESQNAGLIVRRAQDPIFKDCVVFEAFEASPRNEDVLATKAALVWDFPGIAVAVPYTTFSDEDFQTSVASFIEQASLENTKTFAAHTFKAGAIVYEYRNTGDPSIITSMLMAILEENGRRIAPILLRKRVRDDVCWNRAEKPWRRLPLWLVIRVGIQRYLSTALDAESGRLEYKFYIAVVLSKFLDEAPSYNIGIERVHFLKKKICRRLVKLDLDKQRCVNDSIVSRYGFLFDFLGPKFNKSIENCNRVLNVALAQERASLHKHIPLLPRKAADADLRLSLRISRAHLHNALERFKMPRHRRRQQTRPNEGLAEAAKDHLSHYAQSYHKLIDRELELSHMPGETCSEIAKRITDYANMAVPLYEGNPEQKSQMILTIMEMWQRMDAIACHWFPLLQEFHPVLHPQMLDVLLLPQYTDMARLNTLQLLLSARVKRANSERRNIFEDPSPGCFGERYYSESADACDLKQLHESIVEVADDLRASKESEWKKKSQRYDDLIRQIDTSVCSYLRDDFDLLGREQHDPNCPRCSKMWSAQKMRIAIFEDLLPSDPVVTRATVFELACPKEFAVYRETTWWILRQLAAPFHDEGNPPRCLLKDNLQLKPFFEPNRSKVGLASTTKPFITTHYTSVPFPVEWQGGREGVCRPNGMKLGMFDEGTCTWPGRLKFRPTFAHHVALTLPKSSPFSKLFEQRSFAPGAPGPSSYEIMASQSSCPAGVNVHEYLAMQTLTSGKAQRWLALLTELGSTNLNFSSEVTLLVVSNLVCQSGPADDDGISGNDSGGERERDVLRKVHKIFREEQFCDRLVEQLIIRLDSLEANWRETYLMDVVITILLRTHTLTATNPNASLKALSALIRARQICLRWVEMLRAETYKESDTEAARRCQQYALWAAILCKRTFVIHRSQATLLDELSLQAYIECCITVQDNLVVEVGALPQVLQHAVVSDLKLSYRLASLVCASIIQSPDVFRLAIRAVWPEPEDRPRQIYNLCSQQPSWVACDIQENEEGNLVQVHYNYVQGLLLVDNKPLGKLPKAPEHIEVLNELFGDQALLTFPSTQKGMDYTLCLTPRNYRVDVGFEAGNMIVRATKGNQYLQLIPREVFRTETSWDLPGPLLDDCWHWLDLKSGKVFITHTTDIWNIHLRNWTLDVHRGVCQRSRGAAGYDKIVDTYSPLFNRVGRIFDGFEHKGQILVYQPASRHLEVEIRRLQLLFYVNPRQVLQSPQLGSEIDLDQDAGTWYGLSSKLVFRNPRDPSQRSILVPVGPFEAKRIEGKDIMIACTHPTDMYGRFNINKSLGRVDCAAEPMLLYMKALLHAYTSSVFPDPLTGRTGTEEALQWLSSGVCQPWQVLGSAHVNLLAKIAHLSPRHEYYPEDLRVMKTDMWDDSATESIQHERFRPLVERILSVSDELHTFSLLTSETGLAALPAPGDDHLRHRAESRRQVFERCFDDRIEPIGISDQRYRSRDCPLPSNTRHCQTLEIAHLIRSWPEQLSTTSSLAIQLSMGSSVGGFREAYDKVSLTDRLGVDVLENWGSLVKACREQQSPFALMFVLAPIAFSFKVDMCLIKTLAAFAIFDELKVIELPMWERYENFRPNQLPQLEQLMRIIALHKMPPPKDDGEELQQFASAKQLRKMREQRDAWERRSDEDCKYLANFLLSQWPCEEPGVAELAKSLLVDVGAALKVVRVEWKRLYQNMDLSIHLDAVQNVLDRKQSEVEYEAPVFIASEELFEERLRGGEILRLRTDLLQKTFPTLQSIDSESRKPNSQPAKVATKTTTALNEARHPAHIRKPITLPSSNVRSTGTNVLAPSWMSSKTALIPSSDSTAELKQMVASFSKSPSMVRQKYGEDLQRSLDAFVTRKQPKDSTYNEPTAFVAREASLSLMSIQRRLEKIQQALEKPDDTHSSQQLFWLQAGQLWPAVTHVTLLEQLRSTAQPITFGKYAKETLIDFGLAITNTQRDLRINDFVRRGDAGRYKDEMSNQGHSNWQPCDHPDWLLLEIEANLLIRPDQVDVALATISPASGNNSVLQMNMGQGKTSCIIPMVAAALANRQNLVRVVVPKALLLQTSQLLQGRLGGLLDRQVRHLPFSRRTPTEEHIIRAYHRVHRTMMKEAGVMVCQPEHNLSFMLSGLQRLLDNRVPEAGPMINVQSWLRTRCRDILDESDHTLAVRTQLIYPSGSQTTVDGHPSRWQVTQAILRLVDRHSYGLTSAFPNSMEVVRRPGGGFPLLFFLRSDVEEELIRGLTADVLRGTDGILPIQSLEAADRLAIREFLTGKPRDVTLQRIRQLCPDRPAVRQTVYLLRGILANRILMMTLKKRWNVQYGLHPLRDPIAVPYHAKGVPSEQSEWGHPDVAILFTCLAFYYDGISVSQLTQSLEHLLKSDDPSAEYDKWTQTTESFPESLKAWNSINVDDDLQLVEIWKAVRYNMTTIDYFMNNFVFPQHAKQFRVKLQSNGWDIPLFTVDTPSSNDGDSQEISRALTTGFSGTNDNRTMLPLTIKQEDLPGLSHTNAEVLTYLLHKRSRECRKIEGCGGERATESDLLQELRRRDINILIDAGAQILEMDNVTLAKKWLEVDQRAFAALFFDEQNKPWVIQRTGRKTPLLASPYADDLSRCLVYLDEAHTRGTDLKFPPSARGALTLGLGQSKDHTVQAAMRLRQLGTTQAVTFFAPPEVYQSILDLQSKPLGATVDSHDVICWLLDNTCDGIEQLQPLYYAQGIDFCRRMQATVEHPEFLRDKAQREDYLATIKQNEQFSLQQMYEPKRKVKGTGEFRAGSNLKIRSFVKELNTRRKAFQDTGRAVHASALQEVEQEREVAFEVETVRQVKKPLHYPALSFPGLAQDIESFALNGRIPAGSQSFVPVLKSLAKTGTGKKFKVADRSTQARLFVSTEFERTIKLTFDLTNDNFLRNVNWILWSDVSGVALVVVPEEAEMLLPLIRNKGPKHVTHLILYSAPVTRKMLHFSKLDYLSIPPLANDWEAPMWLRVELGLYAGRLYFEWDEYAEICRLLGIDETSLSEHLEESSDEDLERAQLDGAVESKPSAKPAKTGLTPRPLTFCQEWLAARRRGQDFVSTPMGFIAQGKPLQATHPFFRKTDTEKHDKLFVPISRQKVQQEADDQPLDDFGLDYMGENENADSDADDDEIEYNESEMGSDGEDPQAESDSEY
ncbi:hypothetical protein CGLO_02015 [Colletotrichum gloeosporioides Cg-14]|uniref:ubiquitinyl hydrolase 1 n=1 Tax=Colletotrichum gloeosporioides (strain Cg-14) TaxID=1237896 RepID=T0KPP1_COLGC|nr:hypothetical protein CGLO_02015 [Colletotrichum gloeosporioides Cg-14]